MKARFVKARDGQALGVFGTTAMVKVDADESDGAYELVVVDAIRGSDVPPHRHAWAETYYMLSGEIEVQIGARSTVLRPGDLVTIPARAVHAFTVLTDEARFLHVSIGRGATAAFAVCNELFPGIPKPEDLPRLLEVAAQVGVEIVLDSSMTARDQTTAIRVSDAFSVENPGADVSATEVSINVIATAELLFGRLDAIVARHGLSRGGFNLLQVLAGADEPLTPTQIGERVLVRAATVTGLVDTLERRGLVERQPHPDDRRRVFVVVTTAGRRALAAANDVVFESDAVSMASLSEPERERLIRLLGKLQHHLRQVRDPT